MQTFGKMYTSDDLHPFLDTYNATFFESCIAAPEAFCVLVAEPRKADQSRSTKDVADVAEIVGFALVSNSCELPHNDIREDDNELKKLYVAPEAQGTGVADELMRGALNWCLGGTVDRRIWLGVYSENVRAQKFYARYGFAKVGEYMYEVGNARDLEWIMRRL